MKKIAVPAEENGSSARVSVRFGRCPYILFFKLSDEGEVEFETGVENSGASAAHGAGTRTVQLIADSGADVVIAPHVGPNAWQALSAAGIEVFTVPENVSAYDAVQLYANKRLEKMKGPDRAGMH